MAFDTKIKIALRDDLEPWQELNVNSFLMSGITSSDNIVGDNYVTKDGYQFLPMSKQPIMIHSASAEQLNELLKKAVDKDFAISIFTKPLFNTFNDDDNRAEIASHDLNDLDLVGIGVRGKKNQVDKLFKKLPLHK